MIIFKAVADADWKFALIFNGFQSERLLQSRTVSIPLLHGSMNSCHEEETILPFNKCSSANLNNDLRNALLLLYYEKLKCIKRLFYISRLMEHTSTTNTCMNIQTCINHFQAEHRKYIFAALSTRYLHCYIYWFIWMKKRKKERIGLENL